VDGDDMTSDDITFERAASRSGPSASHRSGSPTSTISPWRWTLRYWIARTIVWMLVRAIVRMRFEGRERLPAGPAIYCFNHLGWVDPFMLMATLPFRPRLLFFGPKEEDMAVGGRNRVMLWTGTAIPYKPGKSDLREAARRVAASLEAGRVVAIAGEGRIHVGERYLLPLSEGAAYFAIRSHVPLVPVAINGTSWLLFGGRVRVRVGDPIEVSGRPTHEAVSLVTEQVSTALRQLLDDAPDVPVPGRLWRLLTERFNVWPEGSRAATAQMQAALERTAPDEGDSRQ
jgi:1-acyl-sn-glycerol-3-phosphate acyltransferase